MTAPNLQARPSFAGLGPVGRPFPIVPHEGGSGSVLVAVIAVLAFLAALAAGAAGLVASASSRWRESVSREATIQVRPVQGRDEEADLARVLALARAAPGVRSAMALSRRDAERLLEPWLGSGLDLSELPVPRLVALRLQRDPGPDLGKLALALRSEVPGASVDDHGVWLSRLSAVTASAIGVAAAAVLLVLAASAGAVAFATRGAVLAHRSVVEVLHMVGAADGYVARLFARRFMRLGILGGLLGSGAAVLLLLIAARLSDSVTAASVLDDGDAVAASWTIGPWIYGVMGLVAFADGAIAGLVAAATVWRFVRAAE